MKKILSVILTLPLITFVVSAQSEAKSQNKTAVNVVTEVLDTSIQQNLLKQNTKTSSKKTESESKNKTADKKNIKDSPKVIDEKPKTEEDETVEYELITETELEEVLPSDLDDNWEPENIEIKDINPFEGEKKEPVIEEEKVETETNKSVEEKKESDEDDKSEIKTEDKEEVVEEVVIEDLGPKKIPLSIASEEILSRPDVEKFRKQYMTPKWAALLHSYLESGVEYRLYVRQQVKLRNLPEVLEYLPVVESNYKTSAKSNSGAVGMWQFMSNSVYPFLTLNDFVDQRLDPWYSTDAGLSKLVDNYNYFGDWLLAIAAYNCGGGKMTKAIKASGGIRDFWYLADNGYLPKETAAYVPKLLAIADLAINSEYYGIDLPNHNEEFEKYNTSENGFYDFVTVDKAYSIKQLANQVDVSPKTMEKLNASYTMGITHPTKKSVIRLPSGMAETAENALKELTPIEYPFKYKVVAGDSLWSISRKYKVTVDEICDLNNIKEDAILRIGKILYIPSK